MTRTHASHKPKQYLFKKNLSNETTIETLNIAQSNWPRKFEDHRKWPIMAFLYILLFFLQITQVTTITSNVDPQLSLGATPEIVTHHSTDSQKCCTKWCSSLDPPSSSSSTQDNRNVPSTATRCTTTGGGVNSAHQLFRQHTGRKKKTMPDVL